MRIDLTDPRIDAITVKLATLIDAWPKEARAAILKHEAFDAANISPEDLQDIRLIAFVIGKAVARYAQLHTILEDTGKCALMARRYPWHGTEITRPDHFYFVWLSFSNQCYLYRERTRSFLNDLNRVRRIFSEDAVDVASALRAIDKQLGEHIRHRGSHTHEWHEDHVSYRTYKLVDFLSQFDGKYADKRKDHYADAKMEMGFHIDRAIGFMCEFFDSLPGTPDSKLKHYGQKLNDLIKQHT